MEVLDAFNSDAFKLANLTHSINHIDHKPTRLAELGLFMPEGITTTTVQIEEDYGTLTLVPVKARGGVPEPVSRDRRKAIPFIVPHIPTMTQVQADEVQDVRAFASGNRASADLMAVEQVRDRKLEKARMRLDATIEYHRMGAIRGQLLDSDGTSVILNLFTAFGVSQSTFGMNLDDATTKILQSIREAQRLSLGVLKSQMISGWHAICSDDFFDNLVGHPKLEQLYLNHQAAQTLREGIAPYSTFSFGGITWENYRGSVGGVDFVPAGKAYLIPLGVPDLFVTYFAPADYMETVNTIGLPFYAKSEMQKMNKGIDIEAQTNPLCLCTKPAAVVELDDTAS